MSILFFDTETTGMINPNLPLSDPQQPRLVQLGAILTDDDGRVAAEINFIVRPEGFDIPKESTDIHGISTEFATSYGLPVNEVLDMFFSVVEKSDLVVAHNISFDLKMIESECLKSFHDLTAFSEMLSVRDKYCTMLASTPVLKIPSPYSHRGKLSTDYKWPKLQQAYMYFFGRPFEGAHDAMADVRACKDVYFKLREIRRSTENIIGV